MESNVQRFSVISKTPNSEEENRSPSTPCQPISETKEPPLPWIQHLRSNKQLPKHIIVLEGKQVKYKCTVCSTTFKSKSNCCYHKHCGDDAEKPFTCSICARKFSTKTHFSYHTMMHLGVNPFKCRECGKSFKTRNKLRRHQVVHTEMQKRYSCEICGRAYLRKSSVQVHKRVHTGVKPYQCNECPKAFREKKNLIFHLNHHTGIKDWVCEVCGKSYSIKWDLESHKRTHSRVRSFLCNINKCQQTFAQKRYLKRHMETHKNFVKFICSICEKEFSRKDNLQRHIVNTHLESQNPNALEIEKTKQLLDTAPYIKMITVHGEEEHPDEIVLDERKKVSVVRTESVIVSAIRTQGVVSYPTDREGDIPNRISVIRTVGEVAPFDPEKKRTCRSFNRNVNDETTAEEVRTSAYLPGSSHVDRDAERDVKYLESNLSSDPTYDEEESVRFVVNSDVQSENQVSCREPDFDDHSFRDDANDSVLLRLFETADPHSADVHPSLEETARLDQNESSVAYYDRIQSESRTVTWEIPNDNRYESDFHIEKEISSIPDTVEDVDRDFSLRNDEPSVFQEICSRSGSQFLRTASDESFPEASQNGRTSPLTYHELRNCSSIGSNPFSCSAVDEYANGAVDVVSHFVPHFVPERNAVENMRTRSVFEEICNRSNLRFLRTAPDELVPESSQNGRTSPSTYHELRNRSSVDSNPFSHSAIDKYANGAVETVSHFVPHFVPERIPMSENMRTRCMLPKKVIAALYRDSLTASEIENTLADVPQVTTKDSYKLLDLSMKSQ